MSIKLLLASLLVCFPAQAVVVRPIVIDHTKMGGSDQTNFAFPVIGTYSYLATVANGGTCQNASGFDVEFWADSGRTTKLAWETILYTAATGQVMYWVQAPSISHTADTTIYVSCGDISITTDQSNKTGTWNSDFVGVYHLQQTAGPYLDSTSNAIDSTGGIHPNAISSTLFSGINAQQFIGASSQGISFTSSPFASVSGTNWTAAGWFKVVDLTFTNVIFDFRGLSGIGGPILDITTSGKIEFFRGPSGPDYLGTTNLADGNWHHFMVTGAFTVYLDGSLEISQSSLVSNANVGGYFGQSYGPTYSDLIEQDLQFSITSAHTADWDTASYNSQHSPSTFYSIGAPVTPTIAARHQLIES